MRHLLTGKFRHTIGLLLSFCIAVAAFGWGDETHRAVSRGAAVILPDEMRPFFIVNSEYIAQHSTDPDYIPNRTQAQRAEHFFDLDAFGAPPFKNLPHDRAELEKKFGADFVVQHGLLPWTVNREFERLVKAFRERDWNEARLAAACLSHFVADSTIPLHATRNYNGRLTGNDGIYHRITVEMVGRYDNPKAIAPAALIPIGDPVEWTFGELEKDLALCPDLLKADNDARRAAPLDSEAYYLELYRLTRPIVDERSRDAANAVAGFWAAAWQKAGRPALPPQRLIVVLVQENPTKTATTCPAPEEVAKSIAAIAAPFDAIAAGHTGYPSKAPRLSLRFAACGDARERSLAAEDVGQPADAIQTMCRAFEQFPNAQRLFVFVTATDGWSMDKRLPEAIARLKATGAKSCVFACGHASDDILAAKQFAVDCGAAFRDLGESHDVPALVAQDLAPLLAPVDAR
jgi:hypothetical protein